MQRLVLLHQCIRPLLPAEAYVGPWGRVSYLKELCPRVTYLSSVTVKGKDLEDPTPCDGQIDSLPNREMRCFVQAVLRLNGRRDGGG